MTYSVAMNSDPESIERYLGLIDKREAQDLQIVGVTKEGNGLILAGSHSQTGFCWCYPIVVRLPCLNENHPEHVKVNHRRTMDGDVLEDENPLGFDVDRLGNTYPSGQVCVGPSDKPKLS